MALTKKDLHEIQNLLTAQDQRLRLDLREALVQQATDIKRDIREEMDARFFAFERKMDAKFAAFQQEIRKEMQEMGRQIRQEIRTEFLDVLQQNILPVIDQAFQEIREVRRFVGMA